MELRHLRYFLAVAEALNFTKAATRLRVAQPALSRQVQDLEEEIGVDLLKRSPRGVTLTAEGKVFLDETRKILACVDDAVEKTRALARGEYGELHIGYAPSPSIEILPPTIAEFQTGAPGVKVSLYDMAEDEMISGLLAGSIELAITVEQTEGAPAGIEFEELFCYSFRVAMAPGHPLARKRSLTIEEIARQPLAGLDHRSYAEYHRKLGRIFAPLGKTPRIATECDGSTSLITALEVGHGIAVVSELFQHISGKRLAYRRIAGVTESHGIGIARASKGDVTPAGERFCEIMRKTSEELRRKRRSP